MPQDAPRDKDVVTIREARDADMAAIAAIYAEHVLTGLASFEEVPPDSGEMQSRRTQVLARGLPYLVAEIAGTVCGYGYASGYRARPGYRFALEDSVYVRAGLEGRGMGTALLAEIIARCEKGPWRQMIAVIGDSANAGSIALHSRMGFRMVGTLESVGFKLGRWVDTVFMQRPLGPGGTILPS